MFGVLSEHCRLTLGLLFHGLIANPRVSPRASHRLSFQWVLKRDPKWDPTVRPNNETQSEIIKVCQVSTQLEDLVYTKVRPKWDPKCNPKWNLKVRPKDLVRQKCAKWFPKLQLHVIEPYQQNSNTALLPWHCQPMCLWLLYVLFEVMRGKLKRLGRQMWM